MSGNDGYEDEKEEDYNNEEEEKQENEENSDESEEKQDKKYNRARIKHNKNRSTKMKKKFQENLEGNESKTNEEMKENENGEEGKVEIEVDIPFLDLDELNIEEKKEEKGGRKSKIKHHKHKNANLNQTNQEVKKGTISTTERFNYNKPKEEKKPKYKNYLEEIKLTNKKPKKSVKKKKNTLESSSMFVDDNINNNNNNNNDNNIDNNVEIDDNDNNNNFVEEDEEEEKKEYENEEEEEEDDDDDEVNEEKDNGGFVMERNKNRRTKKKNNDTLQDSLKKSGTISRAERFNYKQKDETKPKYKNYLEELKLTNKKSPRSAGKNRNPLEFTNLSNSLFNDDFHFNNKVNDNVNVIEEDFLDRITDNYKRNESFIDIDMANLRDEENEIEEEKDEEMKDENENNNDDDKRVMKTVKFNPFMLFITLEEVEDLPTNLGLKSVYLLLQISCEDPSKYERSDTIKVFNNKGKWNENTVIELKCLRPLEELSLKVILCDGETDNRFAYIYFPLNQSIPNPIEFTYYRPNRTLIPRLKWEVSTDENQHEVKDEIAEEIEKNNIPQLTFGSIDVNRNPLSSYIMSYKYNLFDEDILKSRFNVRVHYDENTGTFYFVFSSIVLGCNVGKKVTQEDLITEFQLGLSLLNDFSDIYEEKMRNYLLAEEDIDEQTTVTWLLRRILIVLDDKQCYLTHEIKKSLNSDENENPYYNPPNPVQEAQERIKNLHDYYDNNRKVKEKMYIVDNMLKDVAQSKIPAVTFDLDSLDKAAKLSASLCRPQRQIEPSLQYKFDLKIDKEKAARIQKKAREIVNKVRKEIEMDEIEYQLRVKREMQEEMRLLNLVEKHRIDDIKRREEREIHKLEKDAENYAKYMKTQRRIQREQYHSMIRDTRLTTFGIGNIKGAYFGPAPIIKDQKTKPSETVNDEYYYDENGRKHKKSEKMTVSLRNDKLLESPFESADEKRGRLVEKQLFNTIQNMGNDYNYCDIYSPFAPYMDKDTGDISYSEFRLGLESLSIHLEDWQLDSISDFYDRHGVGKVNLDRFFYAYFTRKQSKQWEKMILNLGKMFKKDESIKKTDLRNKLRLNNIHQPNYEFNQLMSVLDHENKGLIKVEDFIRFLGKNPNSIDYEIQDKTIKLDYTYQSTKLIENDGIYEETKRELERLKQKQRELEDMYDI